jgi:hypothetical protein
VVVGDHQDRRAAVVRHLSEQLHHASAAHAVERGGRLVRQDQRRLVRQGSGDGHALLLAAAEHLGVRVLPARDVQVLEQLTSALSAVALATELARDLHVLPRREERREVRLLEHEAEVTPAQRGQVRERNAVLHDEAPPEIHLPRVGGRDEAQGLDERGLARPAGPEQRGHRPAGDRQADVVQRLHGGRARPVGLAQLHRADGVFHGQPSSATDGSMRMTCVRPRMLARVTMAIVAMGATSEMASVMSTRRGNIG